MQWKGMEASSSSILHSGLVRCLETVPREGQDLPKDTQHVGGRVEFYTPAPDSSIFHPSPLSVHSETLGLRARRLGVSEIWQALSLEELSV